jgi:hypothetical protein
LADPAIDKLPAQEEFVTALQRFRNASFHYKEDPRSDKLLKFLDTAGSEVWIPSSSVAGIDLNFYEAGYYRRICPQQLYFELNRT